jgi:hypothetical protein
LFFGSLVCAPPPSPQINWDDVAAPQEKKLSAEERAAARMGKKKKLQGVGAMSWSHAKTSDMGGLSKSAAAAAAQGKVSVADAIAEVRTQEEQFAAMVAEEVAVDVAEEEARQDAERAAQDARDARDAAASAAADAASAARSAGEAEEDNLFLERAALGELFDGTASWKNVDGWGDGGAPVASWCALSPRASSPARRCKTQGSLSF